MAKMQPRFSYTSRNYEKLREACIATIQATEGLNQKWTDFNESDPGVAIVELLAAIGDELAFHQDMYALEAFWPTARQRKSIVNLAKLIGYRLDPAVSSEGIATFRWVGTESPFAEVPVYIPRYTRLSTAGPEVVPFVTVEGATLPAGSSSVDVRIRQGVLYEEEFESAGDEYQEFTLSRNDIASNFGAIEVLVGQGENLANYVRWFEAPNFLIQSVTDNQSRFVVESNHRDQITVKFGDGRFGAIPQEGFSVVVRYLASSGADGNVGANTVRVLVDPIKTSTGAPASLSVTNIEHARRQAPQELAALHRMVTRQDAAALINGLAGIGKAQVWGEQEMPHPDIRHFNHMYVTFVAEGITPKIDEPETWLPTTAMRNLIKEFVVDKKILTTEVIFIDPNVVFVDVQVDAYVEKTASPVTMKQVVLDTLDDFFAIDRQEFGDELRYSNLLAALNAIPNVQYVRLKVKRNGVPIVNADETSPGTDPAPDPTQWVFDEQDIIARRNEFVQLGAVVASDGSQNYVHYGRDEEPLKAKLIFYPHYQNVNVPVVFDGTGSSSPKGEVVRYTWHMGARGVLLQRLANGSYIESPGQPADQLTVTTTETNLHSEIIWKYTERPANGTALVLLVVEDWTGAKAAASAQYEIRA
jgi:hypothetical protein